MELKTGLIHETSIMVEESNTAIAYGSGGVRVFATPAMIGLMEKAALELADQYLPEGETTVGTLVNIKHTAATPVGMKVVARAELIQIEGKKLSFVVEARDETGPVGAGKHERFIVNQEKFLQRAESKLD
ncbi:Thioesterase superfamily [Desulforamulus reducens MI-1]|uniref:Thioesterase superfamily n=1 Tax=Desulforamulus reducens (strain ATCC BAA-1160 / DSM 100696 / MI-1) TaxID=349161 RepID=A4J0S5_DESRM|nr:thioesterase family protein [Desulforamulus reducens]ABO48678.1 Thioesterase superfamily [Desulforamulus reducens MI-1]